MSTPRPTSPHTPYARSNQAPCEVAERTRVLIVDDHYLLRTGIAFALQTANAVEVVGEASSGEEALHLSDEVQPDVVLMDMRMPGMGGVETIRALRAGHPEVHVLALSSFPEAENVQAALAAGAIGFLEKDVTPDELTNAIHLAHQGIASLAPAAARALVRAVASPAPEIGHNLTQRQHEVLALLLNGMTNGQIAEHLVVSLATVKFHMKSIRTKLGTANRAETVAVAIRQHLVPES